ncbi:MAG: hypothetical protein AB7F50_09020 [Fimbriimonadaceae bacterium]
MRHWLPIVILLLAQGPRAVGASGWVGQLQGSASYRCQRLAIAVATAREQIGLAAPSSASAANLVPEAFEISFEPSVVPLSELASDGVRPRDGPFVS